MPTTENNNMQDEWKPSFWEVARSQTWTENFLMYFATFGAIILFIFNPQNWMEWVFIVILDMALTIGYWTLMVNYQRKAIGDMHAQLQRQKQHLKQLEIDLQQMQTDTPDNDDSKSPP